MSERHACRLLGNGEERHHLQEPLHRLDADELHTRTSLPRLANFDNTMLRIGSMNMLLHGEGEPRQVRYKDSLVPDRR